MINESDWSQLVPDLIVAVVGAIIVTIILAIVGLIIAYFKSERFSEWIKHIFKRLRTSFKWLIRKWRLILLIGFLAVFNFIVYLLYADWKIVVLSLVNFIIGLLVYRLFANSQKSFMTTKMLAKKSKYVPIAIPPGIGNSYFINRFLDPPLGDIEFGGIKFMFETDSLIFDTNNQLHYYLPRNDGSKEIEFTLPEPINNIKSAYFLINSGNSKSIYASEKVGEIILMFKDGAPLITELILGKNIREWCIGNPGDFVREMTDPLTKNVWEGTDKQGANAVIDCLEVPVFALSKNNALEIIKFIYKPTQHATDAMGVHYSIFAVSLKIEQNEI